MSQAATFPIGRRRFHDDPVNPETCLPQPSDVSHGNDMAIKRIDEDRLDRIERIIERTAEAAEKRTLGYNGEKRKSNWLLAGLAVMTLFASAGNFIGSSGIFVGSKLKESEQLAAQQKEIKDEIAYLKTWNEKLRNNMAAYGWLIDNEGNVSRIEDNSKRRR